MQQKTKTTNNIHGLRSLLKSVLHMFNYFILYKQNGNYFITFYSSIKRVQHVCFENFLSYLADAKYQWLQFNCLLTETWLFCLDHE